MLIKQELEDIQDNIFCSFPAKTKPAHSKHDTPLQQSKGADSQCQALAKQVADSPHRQIEAHESGPPESEWRTKIALYPDWNFIPRILLMVGNNSQGQPQKLYAEMDTGSTFIALSPHDYHQNESLTAHSTGLFWFQMYALMSSASTGWTGHQVEDLIAYGHQAPFTQRFFVEDTSSLQNSLVGFDQGLGSGWLEMANTAGLKNFFLIHSCNIPWTNTPGIYNGSLFPGYIPADNDTTVFEYIESSYWQQFLSYGWVKSYPVELVDITINGILIRDSCWKMNGLGMSLFDTGTSGMYLPEALHSAVVQVLKTAIKADNLTGIPDDFFDGFHPTWITVEQYIKALVTLPSIKLGFRQKNNPEMAVQITIPPQNYIPSTLGSSYGQKIRTVWIYNILRTTNPYVESTLIGTSIFNGHDILFAPDNNQLGIAVAACEEFPEYLREQFNISTYKIEGDRGSCTGPLAGLALFSYALVCPCCGLLHYACFFCCKKKCKSRRRCCCRRNTAEQHLEAGEDGEARSDVSPPHNRLPSNIENKPLIDVTTLRPGPNYGSIAIPP